MIIKELSIKVITETIKNTFKEEELQLYKDLGNGLYELPGNIVCNKKGLAAYLKELKHKVKT